MLVLAAHKFEADPSLDHPSSNQHGDTEPKKPTQMSENVPGPFSLEMKKIREINRLKRMTGVSSSSSRREHSDPNNGQDRNSNRKKEGQMLFRKMATSLVQVLKNETLDPWELGAEASRLWPAYREMAENGCGKGEIYFWLVDELLD